MGRVRTKTIKKSAKLLIEKYFSKMTNDFQINKKILEEVSKVPSKRLKNKIAGFATHLMVRIQKGPVRGISLKVQEEEREKRLDFIPEKSKVDINHVVINEETQKMLRKVGMDKIPGLVLQAQQQGGQQKQWQKKQQQQQ